MYGQIIFRNAFHLIKNMKEVHQISMNFKELQQKNPKINIRV
jgi:hypothetical protein